MAAVDLADVASFDWNDHRINLIDTPGYADFRGEALLGMSAADLAVFVIDGVAGVQSQDERCGGTPTRWACPG